jgi:hypothetical protein
MSRRTAILSLLVGLLSALTFTLPALAKTGAEARLDSVVHRDAEPGSTIDVAWSLFQVVDDRESPFSALGVYMRLTGVDGKSSTEVIGTETPSGSGHYAATIQVPASGIGQVVVGLKGDQCTAADGCSRMDIIFPLTDDRLVVGSAPVEKALAAPSATPIGSQLAPLVAIGVAIAVSGGLVALILGRRRTAHAPAGH